MVKSLIWPWGQMSPTMVRDTSSGGGLPTCQIWKACLERQKVTAPTRFVMDARNNFTLRSKFKVKNNGTRHIVWRWSTYMPNMQSLSWMTKKLQPRTRFATDARTDRLITIGHLMKFYLKSFEFSTNSPPFVVCQCMSVLLEKCINSWNSSVPAIF
jgi:hypothetical protein